MTISAERGWLVADQERAYGPYDLSQLSSFLTPEHWVFHHLTADWTRAAHVELLKPVLAGKVPVAIEWYYRAPNGREQGPFARAAIVRMIRDQVITEQATIRHQDWPQAKSAMETAFAAEFASDKSALSNGKMPRFSESPIDIKPIRHTIPLRVTSETVRQMLLALVLLAAVCSGLWWYLGYADSQQSEKQMNNALLAVIRDSGQVPVETARRFTQAFNSTVSVEKVSLEDWQRAMAAIAVMARPHDHTAADLQEARQGLMQSLRAAKAGTAAQTEVLDAFDEAISIRNVTDTGNQ